MRAIGILFAVAVSFAPASAFACGMYIPPEHEELLTTLFDEIDQAATLPVVDEAMAVQMADATVTNEANDVVVAPLVDDSRPHRKLFHRNSAN